ncbi:hypothetical protein F5I97DRAFT_1868282 [Phlebopus sp. FC_14]|nr:hypothetical protein F5I97DRAFT_1868282 [Phlebopus sp. FC_14]
MSYPFELVIGYRDPSRGCVLLVPTVYYVCLPLSLWSGTAFEYIYMYVQIVTIGRSWRLPLAIFIVFRVRCS